MFTLHTVPAQPHQESRQGVAQYAGFSPAAKHVRMTWAQRLKRVFAIDIDCCRRCGGKLKVIASIEEPALIERIIAHLKQHKPAAHHSQAPFAARAPPQHSLF